MQKESDLFAQQIRDQLRDNPTARVHMPVEAAQESLDECYEERAAIREYCGGQSRGEAERAARVDVERLRISKGLW